MYETVILVVGWALFLTLMYLGHFNNTFRKFLTGGNRWGFHYSPNWWVFAHIYEKKGMHPIAEGFLWTLGFSFYTVASLTTGFILALVWPLTILALIVSYIKYKQK